MFDFVTTKLLQLTLKINEALAVDISGGTHSPPPPSFKLEAPFGLTSFSVLFDRVITFFVSLAVVIAPLLILWGAYQIMFAAGDPGKVTKGMEMIKYTIIGLIVVFLSKMAVTILTQLLSG